jgi:hypothetical protein
VKTADSSPARRPGSTPAVTVPSAPAKAAPNPIPDSTVAARKRARTSVDSAAMVPAMPATSTSPPPTIAFGPAIRWVPTAPTRLSALMVSTGSVPMVWSSIR